MEQSLLLLLLLAGALFLIFRKISWFSWATCQKTKVLVNLDANRNLVGFQTSYFILYFLYFTFIFYFLILILTCPWSCTGPWCRSAGPWAWPPGSWPWCRPRWPPSRSGTGRAPPPEEGKKWIIKWLAFCGKLISGKKGAIFQIGSEKLLAYCFLNTIFDIFLFWPPLTESIRMSFLWRKFKGVFSSSMFAEWRFIPAGRVKKNLGICDEH